MEEKTTNEKVNFKIISQKCKRISELINHMWQLIDSLRQSGNKTQAVGLF